VAIAGCAILDKATLTSVTTRPRGLFKGAGHLDVDLGAREMSDLHSGVPLVALRQGRQKTRTTPQVDQNLSATALEAAARLHLPPCVHENRIDKVVVFRSLQDHHSRNILDLELQAVQERIIVQPDQCVFQVHD